MLNTINRRPGKRNSPVPLPTSGPNLAHHERIDALRNTSRPTRRGVKKQESGSTRKPLSKNGAAAARELVLRDESRSGAELLCARVGVERLVISLSHFCGRACSPVESGIEDITAALGVPSQPGMRLAAA